jgi:hypothetical protein
MKIIDISHYNIVNDWSKLKDDFVIHKCTEATTFIDFMYKERKDKIKASYHFARGGDAVKEAQWFLKNSNENILILDWEIEHADPVGWCKKFKAEIDKAGKTFWFYTNDARAIRFSWPEDWFMWIARYGDYTGEYYPDFFPKCKNWKLHQYTSRGKVDGIDGNVDLNIAKNLEEFNQLINNEVMDKNYKKLFEEVADFLNKDYGDNLDDKDIEDIKLRFKGIDEEHAVLANNVDIQSEKIKNQSEQINALSDKLKEKDLLLQDSQAAADKNFEAVSVIKLFQEAFKKLINFK